MDRRAFVRALLGGSILAGPRQGWNRRGGQGLHYGPTES